MNREAIITALFTRVSAAAEFVTSSRRLKLWSSLSAGEKPAVFLVERSDAYVRGSEAVPEMVTMHAELFIYTDAGQDQSVIPSTILNNLIDAVDDALKADALTGKQTLGGLVSHCWIEGRVMKDAGDLDGQGVAVIPIKILVPR